MNVQNLNEDMIMIIAESGFSIEDYEKLKMMVKGAFPKKRLSFVTFDEDTI